MKINRDIVKNYLQTKSKDYAFTLLAKELTLSIQWDTLNRPRLVTKM